MNTNEGKRDLWISMASKYRPCVGRQNLVHEVLLVTLVVLLGGGTVPINCSVPSYSQSKAFRGRVKWTRRRETGCLVFNELKCRWMKSVSE